MSTTPCPGPDEVIIPSRIYFNEGKRIDVKVWPKTIQLTGPIGLWAIRLPIRI